MPLFTYPVKGIKLDHAQKKAVVQTMIVMGAQCRFYCRILKTAVCVEVFCYKTYK